MIADVKFEIAVARLIGQGIVAWLKLAKGEAQILAR